MTEQTVHDLQAENNRIHQLFERFTTESKSITIAMVALVVSALAALMGWMAVYDATSVSAEQRIVLESNAELKKEIRLLEYKIDLYKARLEATGEQDDE